MNQVDFRSGSIDITIHTSPDAARDLHDYHASQMQVSSLSIYRDSLIQQRVTQNNPSNHQPPIIAVPISDVQTSGVPTTPIHDLKRILFSMVESPHGITIQRLRLAPKEVNGEIDESCQILRKSAWWVPLSQQDDLKVRLKPGDYVKCGTNILFVHAVPVSARVPGSKHETPSLQVKQTHLSLVALLTGCPKRVSPLKPDDIAPDAVCRFCLQGTHSVGAGTGTSTGMSMDAEMGTSTGTSMGTSTGTSTDTGHEHEQLISPCRCSGSIALVHASCLKEWIAHKIQQDSGQQHSGYRKQNNSCFTLYWHHLRCELCHAFFPLSVGPKPKSRHLRVHELGSDPDPDSDPDPESDSEFDDCLSSSSGSDTESDAGAGSEAVSKTKTKTKTKMMMMSFLQDHPTTRYLVVEIFSRTGVSVGLSFVSLVENSRVTIGRDSSSHIPLLSMSISSNHAVIQDTPDGVYINDCFSKFGTLVLTSPSFVLNKQNPRSLPVQIGKSVMWFSFNSTKLAPGTDGLFYVSEKQSETREKSRSLYGFRSPSWMFSLNASFQSKF